MTQSTTRWRILRAGLLTALILTAYTLLVHLWLRPWHEEGFCQPLLGYLNALEHVLQLAGRTLNRLLHVPNVTHAWTAAWCFRIAVNLSSWFLIGCALASLAYCVVPPTTPPTSDAEKRQQARRRFLRRGLAVAAGTAATGLGYALVVEPRWVGVTRRVVPIRDLPPALDGLRIVQVTDIHHGPWLDLDYVRAIVRTANELSPDLLCLTGDYIHHSASYIEPVLTELAELRARIGTVAVLGNHDWWEDVPRFVRAFRKAGIPLIDNDRRVLTPDHRLVESSDRGLVLAGVGDLWEDRQDYERALGGLPQNMPRLLLSHNPDVAEEPDFVRSGLRVDLMLSGHTHGGQIYIPGMGTPVVPSRYGQKYAQGLVQGPTCPVFICRGLGTSILPLRCGVTPEIAVLELRRAGLV